MIVIDASVLVNALTDDGAPGAVAREHLARDSHWAAPSLLPVEAFSALRGRWRGGSLSDLRVVDSLAALQAAAVDLLDPTALLPRMWELRSNVSGYDAAYVATAEHFGCPLVTADKRLGRASGVRCEVRVAAPPS